MVPTVGLLGPESGQPIKHGAVDQAVPSILKLPPKIFTSLYSVDGLVGLYEAVS